MADPAGATAKLLFVVGDHWKEDGAEMAIAADLRRRAQLSHKAAARYLDAFATVDDSTTLDQLLQRLGQPRQGARWAKVRARKKCGRVPAGDL